MDILWHNENDSIWIFRLNCFHFRGKFGYSIIMGMFSMNASEEWIYVHSHCTFRFNSMNVKFLTKNDGFLMHFEKFRFHLNNFAFSLWINSYCFSHKCLRAIPFISLYFFLIEGKEKNETARKQRYRLLYVIYPIISHIRYEK